jgi:adenylate cyclase
VDQNFERMDGIVNPDYAPSVMSSVITQNYVANNAFDASSALTMGYDNESWAPPDSWGVQPVSSMPSNALNEEDNAEFEDYQIDVQEKWDMPKKNVSSCLGLGLGLIMTLIYNLN